VFASRLMPESAYIMSFVFAQTRHWKVAIVCCSLLYPSNRRDGCHVGVVVVSRVDGVALLSLIFHVVTHKSVILLL
jgi:hypothetical protein